MTRLIRAFPVLSVLCCLSLLLLPLPSTSQTVTGTLQGTVVTSGAEPLPGVTVTVRNRDTGQERVTVTNESGNYTVPFLPIGSYTVTANLEGLGSQQRDAAVTLNATTVSNFQLGMSMAETVTVTATQPLINVVNAEIKQSLTAQEVIDKPTPPIAGPNAMLTLAETFAGFQENPTAGQNNPTLSSGSSVNFGTGTRGTTFQINGVNNDDSSENQNRQGVALSTIKEFQVLTQNFSAEFGRATGAIVLVQTKNGTNKLAGDVYGHHSDNEWNDKFHFSRTSPKPTNSRTTLGVTSGFPLIRDRMFAFVSGEQNTFEGELNYARDIFLSSEFSAPRLTRGNDNPANRAFIESVLARFPQVTPNDPRSNRTYATVIGVNQPDDDYSFRLDWTPSSRNLLWARYQYSHQIRESQDVIIGEQARQDNEQYNIGTSWTYTFGPNVVGEARYGLGVRDTNVNIGAGNDTPIIRFIGSPVAGSIIGNAGAFPILRDQKDHQLVYNLNALVFRNHSLKAGFDIRRQQLDDFADNFSRGFYTFRATCGGTTYPSAYAAFLDGCVSTYQRGYGPFFLENQNEEENIYLEDSWAAMDGLTLNLGVRYEHVAAPEEREGRISYGFGDNEYFDPRFSFAYSPALDNRWLNMITGGPGKWSLRGGYGVSHNRLFQSVFSLSGASLRFNPPNAVFLSFTNQTNIADPTNGFVFTPGTPTTRISIAQVEPDLNLPETEHMSLTFERELLWNSSLRVSYTSKESTDQLKLSLANLPVSPLAGGIVVANHPFNAPAAGHPDLRGKKIDKIAADFQCAGTGLPGVPTNATCPNPVPIADNEVSLRVPRTNERRPDPRYGTNTLISDDGEIDYEAIEVGWLKRYSNNLSFQMNYTYSETFDNASETTFVGAGDTNVTGPERRFAYGRSRFDTPHRATLFGTYRLPFFRERKDIVGTLLGGWEISPVVRYASGTPFTVIATGGPDLNFDGFADARPVILDRSIQGRTINNPNNSQNRLPRSAFRFATPADSLGDLTDRNAFRTDDATTFDVSLRKNFRTPWGDTLALRFEGFNVTHEVQYGIPVNDISSANFGRILGTSVNYQPRRFQLGVRYIY